MRPSRCEPPANAARVQGRASKVSSPRPGPPAPEHRAEAMRKLPVPLRVRIILGCSPPSPRPASHREHSCRLECAPQEAQRCYFGFPQANPAAASSYYIGATFHRLNVYWEPKGETNKERCERVFRENRRNKESGARRPVKRRPSRRKDRSTGAPLSSCPGSPLWPWAPGASTGRPGRQGRSPRTRESGS